MNIYKEVVCIINKKVSVSSEQCMCLDTKISSLNINSIDFVLLLSDFENFFDVEISIAEIENYKEITLGEIVQKIKESKNVSKKDTE